MTTTGAGTGTQAAAPDAITAQMLIDQARTALDDSAAAEFSEAELLAFLNEAIREYSQQLPRVSTATIPTFAATYSYTLPWDTRDLITVEYPSSAVPPSYVSRRPRRSRDFFSGQCYDFLRRLDLTQSPSLILSFEPATGQTLTVTYSHPHSHALAAADNVTVPADHHHVLLQYVLFAAVRFQLNQEHANPTSASSLLMSQLQTNMRRLELTYLNALNRALQSMAGSTSTSWRMDDFDRVY